MKHKYSKAVVFALLGLVGFILLSKAGTFVKQPDTQSSTNQDQLLMEWQGVVATGVSSDEKNLIVEFIDTFERAVAQRDSDKALSFFSAPETDEERQELDFILGSDYARDGAKPLARLFTTAGYNFSLAAHYVRAVAAQDASTRVLVDEMRILHTNGEGSVGYFAQVAHLVVELRETSHGYENVKYYHENPFQNRVRKYEGFVAE